MTNDIKLSGKVIISGIIKAETGLHIGGAETGLEIGGVDNVVIRDPLTNQPYIPGSSLKGAMRSLLEKSEGLAIDNERVWVKKPDISLHMCGKDECAVCNIFGRTNGEKEKVTGDKINIETTTPTRLIVRDAKLTNADELEKAKTDMPYTEVKIEVVIDRITSAATPRQIERVPAGAEFEFKMIYNIYNENDIATLKSVFEAMSLLEDDYLGGSGSRGHGQVCFCSLEVDWKPRDYYKTGKKENIKLLIKKDEKTLEQIIDEFNNIKDKIKINGNASSET